MGNVPTPASVARRYAASQGHESSEHISISQFKDAFPRVAHAAARHGIEVEPSLARISNELDPVSAATLVSPDASGFDLAKAVRMLVIRRDSPLPVLAYMIAEEWLRTDAARVSGYFRSAGTSLEAVYRQLVERLGEAFLSCAFDATWQRRAVFGRSLAAAGSYLDYVRQDAELLGRPARRGISTRLGISTVLSARFGPVQESSLREARQLLLDAHENGAEQALTFHIEASMWLFDLYDDSEAIKEAAGLLAKEGPQDSARAIVAAHVWLRLAGYADTATGRTKFIDRGLAVLRDWTPQDATVKKEEAAARVLLQAMFESLREQAVDSVGDLSTGRVLFPFGLRRPDTVMPASFERAIPALVKALGDSDLDGDYVFRDLRAELLSFQARQPATSTRETVLALQEAIQLRTGRGAYQRPLTRPGVEVELAEDRFLLAHLLSDATIRRDGIRVLFGVGGATKSPRHLTVLAREIDERGALGGALLDLPSELALAVWRGDSVPLFEAAARAAYESADLTRVQLGGRGGVVSLRDSDGAAGQTFMFKEMSPEARSRDSQFTSQVSAVIEREGLDFRFGLIEHLTELEPSEDQRSHPESLISVRRYSSGAILGDHLRLQGFDRAAAVLGDAAEFLALIHHAGAEGRDPVKAKRELKEKELGRWLRAVVSNDAERADLFARWWDVVESAPLVPRRDAHPMNWLMGGDGRLLAVDLESTGVRPYAYEVAQLVEDGQVLAPGDWDSRREVLARYGRMWESLGGSPVSDEHAEHYYEAGALARAVRAVSGPLASPSERAAGGKLLESVARNSGSVDVRSIAARLLRHWTERTGNVGEEDFSVLSNAERHRISRAMAYHLRHDPSAPANRDGWVHVEELTELLRAAGHRVSSRQLVLIAGALGEPRFELDGLEIRAVYGHSVGAHINYPQKRPPAVLYHATPLTNLASIFEARAGLLPGRRNWVHMTDSCVIALNAAQRQRSSVAVLEIDAGNVEGLVFATGSTWLAPQVPVSCLRIVPLRDVRVLVESGVQ